MKTISAEQLRLINAALIELGLPISPATLEKDILVTEALRAISAIDLPGLTVTFSGGTCLSKAYGLLERMSEDIDLRLKVHNQDQLSRTALRRARSDLKAALVERLRAADFGLPDDAIRARNENQLIALDLAYQPQTMPEAALRTTVQVEFMAIAPRLPTVPLSFGPLVDQLTGRRTADEVTLACLAIEETYCEKILSYLRRTAEHIDGHEHAQYEGRLARHIYDVHRIYTRRFGRAVPASLPALFRAVLDADVAQYGNRLPAFKANPAGTLRDTLAQIPQRPEFRAHYERFVDELVYGQDRPGFDEAFASFRDGANALLQ